VFPLLKHIANQEAFPAIRHIDQIARATVTINNAIIDQSSSRSARLDMMPYVIVVEVRIPNHQTFAVPDLNGVGSGILVTPIGKF
jgi:hypothetical protein